MPERLFCYCIAEKMVQRFLPITFQILLSARTNILFSLTKIKVLCFVLEPGVFSFTYSSTRGFELNEIIQIIPGEAI